VGDFVQEKEEGDKKEAPRASQQALVTQRKLMFGEILKTGWLSRKSKKTGEWREWWWVLRPGVISYQKNEQVSDHVPLPPFISSALTSP
jgi:hypothetical protein